MNVAANGLPTAGLNPKMASDIERHEQLQIASALNVASEIAHRYRLSSLQPLIQSGRQLAERDELSVAVILGSNLTISDAIPYTRY